jgi:phage terminase large subunit-like protein
MKWSTACLDWEDRIVNRRSLIPLDPLFPDEAEAALEVFKSLRLVDVAGQPTFGEACEEYVFDFVRAVFGAYDAESGQRLIEEFFLLISKKNIKSTLAAGIMLTALIRNWRFSQELLILAPTQEVAGNSFGPAADMVDADDELKEFLDVNRGLKKITHLRTKAVLKVVSADSGTASGKKAGFVLIEELWLFGKKAGAGSMLQEATGGLISRPEGFTIYITTQSDEPPEGVFKEKLDYFRDVRDGKIDDPRSLAVLYEFPDAMVEDKSYLEPKNFYVTNPNMGRSVRQDWLERKLAKVQAGDDEDKDTIQSFLAKHLNVQIGMRNRVNRWAGASLWISGTDKKLSALPHLGAFREIIRRSECVVVGIDGGGLDDLFGFSALGREPGQIDIEVEIDGVKRWMSMARWLSWSHAWCDEGLLRTRKKIAPKLQDLKAEGSLTIVTDGLTDMAEIVQRVDYIKREGKLGGVSVDPAGLGDLIDVLADIDVTIENGLLIGAPQGIGMMNAIKTVERRLKSQLFRHSGGSMMEWAVSNLKIEPTATAVRATKQTAGDAKIDPAMAMFNAATLMARNPVPFKLESLNDFLSNPVMVGV